MGKVFDLFCDAVEKATVLKDVKLAGKPLKLITRNTPLFEIPVTAQNSDLIPKSYSDEEVDFLTETFFLPFPAIVIEDNAGCVFLEDTAKDQKGLPQERWFIVVNHTSRSDNYTADDTTRRNLKQSIQRDGHYMTVSVGKASIIFTLDRKFTGSIGVDAVYGIWQNGAEAKLDAPAEGLQQAAGADIMTAYQEIIAINTPSRFVVKEQPFDVAKRYREADAKKTALRSANRPKYTLLTPHEIKQRFGLASTGLDTAGVNRAPHQRRRHYRTLRSEFFSPEKRGSVILVPACWVGESEKEVNGKKYKVMLDL